VTVHDVDPTADRIVTLRFLASALGHVHDLGDVAGTLEEAADDLERLTAAVAAAPAAPSPFCEKRDAHLHGEKCDRAAKHTGPHSWAIRDLERRGREYDQMVRTVEEARKAVRAMGQRVKRAEADTAHLLAERDHWWSRLPRIFR
jgi:hypothetical protein